LAADTDADGFLLAGADSTGGGLTAGVEGAAGAGVAAGTEAVPDAGFSGRGWIANQVYAPRAAKATAASAITIRLGTLGLH
jgi:hypothetical protein